MQKKQNNKGITLVEVLIVLALIGIVLVIAVQMNLFSFLGLQIGQENAQVQHSVRLASDYITTELRNAYTINILDTLPSPMNPEKRYFYVEGNTIKHYLSGNVTDIMRDAPSDLVPELDFEKDVDNDQVIQCTISGSYRGTDYSLVTVVSPSNLLETDSISGTAGYILEYSSPLTAEEIVEIDTYLLDLQKRNLHLLKDDFTGILTSRPYPYPDTILLLDYGSNGASISWASSDETLITNLGFIDRPAIGAGDETAILTATIIFDVESETKSFTVLVQDMDPLALASLDPAIVGTSYADNLVASGGTGAYTSYNLTSAIETLPPGLTLAADGSITGTPTASGVYDFVVRVTDTDGQFADLGVSLTVNE